MPPTQKPADPKGRLRQTRASPAASTGCAVFAKAGFLCDNKRHPFGNINRPVGAAGAQVPYKHKVTGSNPVPATIKTAGQTLFSSDLFFFREISGKQVPDKLATIGHASLPPKRRAHKNGRRLAPTPENQRAFALKARLSNTGTDAPSVLWTRDAPVPGRESALRATSPIPSRKLKKAAGSADGPQAIRFPCGDPENPERIRRDLQGRRAVLYSPCAPFTAPSISRAWASDASVASPESIRAISAGRSSADSCRRQVWGIPSSPAILVTA